MIFTNTYFNSFVILCALSIGIKLYINLKKNKYPICSNCKSTERHIFNVTYICWTCKKKYCAKCLLYKNKHRLKYVDTCISSSKNIKYYYVLQCDNSCKKTIIDTYVNYYSRKLDLQYHKDINNIIIK